MSVLIKGMEMPTAPIILILFPDGHVETEEYNIGARSKAISVPPHGDCIDRDALKVAICSRLCIKSEKYLSPEEATIVNEIFAAPTIIPASEEGE